MERCTGAVLETYLSEYGWVYRSLGDHQWKTGFQAESGNFPLRINLSDTWLSFHVEPLLRLNVDWESWPEIAVFLLELNSLHPMIKIGLAASGHIELSLDILNRQLAYEDFTLALGLLGFYSDLFYDEILSRLDILGFSYTETLRLLT